MKENAALRAIRALLKMNQGDFASLIGVARTEYTLVDADKLVVNQRIKSRAEAALGVSLDDPRIITFIAMGDEIEQSIKAS